jgi:hypothetical protein
MQRHAHRAERNAAQPGTIQRVANGLPDSPDASPPPAVPGHRANAFFGDHRDNRIRVLRNTAPPRNARWSSCRWWPKALAACDRERRVVEHRLRQHARVASGLLAAAFGDAPDGRHFRARIGGRASPGSEVSRPARWLSPALWWNRRPPQRSNPRPAPCACSLACSAISIGTCITALSNNPAARAPNRDPPSAGLLCVARAWIIPAAIVAPSRSISSGSLSRHPTPKSTRDGSMS